MTRGEVGLVTIKSTINHALSRFGYRLVRDETLARLIRGSEERAPDADRANFSRPELRAAAAVESAPSVRLTLSPATNTPPRSCTMLAPRFNGDASARFARHIVEFQQTGITIIPTDPEAAAHWRESEVFDRSFGNRHSAWDWSGPTILTQAPHIRTGVPSPGLVEALRDLMSGQDFETFFRGVAGCPMTVINCRLVKSLPHSGGGDGPQSWHHDGCPPGVIRGVLYLTDVDEQSGPFQYVDEAGTEHTVLGKPGDLLVFDAMRLRHRARPPERKIRTAIDFVFMPRLPGQEMQINVAGMNHWPADPFYYRLPVDHGGDQGRDRT
jgi:hypothetical protein